VGLAQYDLPIGNFECKLIYGCSSHDIEESITWYTDTSDVFWGLELELCHIVPCCDILESLGIRGKYPDILPTQDIDI
jgi:hypothetical protein